MNVLFITLLDFDNLNTSNIYTDLLSEFVKNGHNVYIISPTEKRFRRKTQLIKELNYQIVKKKIGNIQKTNFIEKGISTLKIDGQFLRTVKRYYKNISFDLVLYSTPPINFTRTISFLKKNYSAMTYLLLKDIFPQNAVDMGVLSTNGLKRPLYWFFRKKEIKLYELSDYIGCMSPANMNYVINHNPQLNKGKFEVNPNSVRISKIDLTLKKESIRKKYHIPENSTMYVYGGNLGKPQGIDFLCECILETEKLSGNINIIVGSGTEYNKIESFIKGNSIKKTILIPFLPKADFDEVLSISDVGLIFLDRRFTIPNYPSRLLSYLQASLPILMTSDSSTDLKDHLVEWKIGLWSISGDMRNFLQNYIFFLNEENRTEMRKNSYKVLVNNFDVKNSYDLIIKHMREKGD